MANLIFLATHSTCSLVAVCTQGNLIQQKNIYIRLLKFVNPSVRNFSCQILHTVYLIINNSVAACPLWI